MLYIVSALLWYLRRTADPQILLVYMDLRFCEGTIKVQILYIVAYIHQSHSVNFICCSIYSDCTFMVPSQNLRYTNSVVMRFCSSAVLRFCGFAVLRYCKGTIKVQIPSPILMGLFRYTVLQYAVLRFCSSAVLWFCGSAVLLKYTNLNGSIW